jgi:hypothetical protein
MACVGLSATPAALCARSARDLVRCTQMNVANLVDEIETRVDNMPVRNAPAMRALRREYSRRIKALPARDVVKIGATLIANRRIPRFIGDELITFRRKIPETAHSRARRIAMATSRLHV